MPHAIPAPRLQLADLPRELVEEILSHVPTKTLVQVSSTSKFLHNIATYLITLRTRHALEVEGYKLIYECYNPIDKYNHPYNPCTYTGTNNSHSESPKLKSFTSDLGAPSSLYSHFSPSTLYNTSLPPSPPASPSSSSASAARTTLSLDSGELFTQVCASANLVRTGPRRGLFESVIPVFENFFRVRREWLDAAYACEDKKEEGGIIWIGMGEDIGLRLKVTGRTVDSRYTAAVNTPGKFKYARGVDEEPSVEYIVEYQELVVRTPYLLEMIEKRKHYSFYQNISVLPQQDCSSSTPAPAVLAY